jgi:ABC-type phosphate/phosphonate transport system substrate-binding protein
MRLPAIALVSLTALVITSFGSGRADESRPIQIGMVRTLFVDIPRPIVNVLAHPFGNLMREQTGVEGQLTIEGDAFHVGKLLHEDKYQVGIFQGIEFAWAQKKYGDLEPLMIAVSKYHTLTANLVTSEDNPATGFAAFRGKDVALPQRSKVHLRLFLARGCQDSDHKEPPEFFSKIARPTSTEDALDEVCSGTIEAAVVDGQDLESYKNIKPGCYKRLKIAQKSEPFPTGVIAVHKGALDPALLAKFRTGMINAHNNLQAREMMAMFQLTAFEPVPEDFDQTVANIIRAYPPPAESAEGKSATKR